MRVIAAWAWFIGAALAVGAHAQCPTTPVAAASAPAMRPYVERFDALAAQDPYSRSGKTLAGWQALRADLARDARTPPDLAARTGMMLALALQGEVGVQPGLAAARDALDRAEAAGIVSGSLHAALLTTLAVKEIAAGKSPQAMTHADAALAETEHADGAAGWAYGNAVRNAADAHFANGDYAGSERLSAIAERLAAACLPSSTSIIGETIASHATDLQSLGRIDEAIAEEERAVTWDMAHLPESDPAVASALADLGFFLHLVNRQREAEALLRRATDLAARYQPEDLSSRALTMSKFANVLSSEGKYREAEQLWLAATDLYARSTDLSHPLAGSGPLRRAADAAQAQGEVTRALDLRRRAVTLIEQRVRPDHPELARARIEYASTLALAGRARDALALAEPAVAVLRRAAPPADPKRMTAEIAYARISGAAGTDAAVAYAAAAPVVTRMETVLLDAATSRGDLIRYATGFAASFGSAARLALAAHDEEAAFHALQLANLSEAVVVSADVAAAAVAGPAVRALVEQLAGGVRDHQRLDRDRVAAQAEGNLEKAAALADRLREVDAGVARTTVALDRDFRAYRALSRPRPVTLAAFRAQLGRDEVLLAPLSLPGETLVVAVTREGLRWASVAAPHARIAALVARVRGAIDAARQDDRARFDTAAARALAEVLLPPALSPVLATHRRLTYYASGALATVPPALLVTAPVRAGGAPAWLIRSHSIAVATTLATRPEASGFVPVGFLGIGAPALAGRPLGAATRGIAAQAGDFGKAGIAVLPRLPNAVHELRAMGALFPAGQRRLLLGTAATKAALRGLPLDRFGVIALATHGLVADALPGLTQPALVLTPGPGGDAADDGLLTAGDIAGLHLAADWVILSACDTAGGSDPEGGSYSGLASAFLRAGARALLVSQWPVRDDAAERITVATLAEARRGTDRAVALQRATLALMRDRHVPGASDPAVWAPFVLVSR